MIGKPVISVEHPWPRRLLRSLQFGIARLASRDGYVEAHAAPFDLVFTGPAADCITRHIYRWGAHEPQIARYLIDHVHLGRDDVGIDVGANLGWYSVLLDRLSVEGAAIFAFEPDPASYRLLKRNLAANGANHVTAVNVALGEHVSTGHLHRYKAANNGRHTLLEGDTSGGLVEVAIDTLERFWSSKALGARPIRFLKIDVEGYELFVLRGAGALLERCACVLLEYSPESLSLAGLAPPDLAALLREVHLGARAFCKDGLVPISLEELMRVRTQCDLLLTPLH